MRELLRLPEQEDVFAVGFALFEDRMAACVAEGAQIDDRHGVGTDHSEELALGQLGEGPFCLQHGQRAIQAAAVEF